MHQIVEHLVYVQNGLGNLLGLYVVVPQDLFDGVSGDFPVIAEGAGYPVAHDRLGNVLKRVGKGLVVCLFALTYLLAKPAHGLASSHSLLTSAL